MQTRKLNLAERSVMSKLLSNLSNQQMYAALALTGVVRLSVLPDDFYAPACVRVPKKAGEAIEVSFKSYMFSDIESLELTLIHELRHIPQVAYLPAEEWRMPLYPEWVKTDSQRKALFRAVANRAMDMALHEDMLSTYGRDRFDKLEALVAKEEKLDKVQLQFRKKEWPAKMDWLTYCNLLLREIKEDQMVEVEGGFDAHDWEDASEEDKQAVKEEMQKAVEKAASEARNYANRIGKSAADMDFVLPRGTLSDQVQRLLREMKVKINRIATGVSSSKYYWSRINKQWPGSSLPGRGSHVEKATGLVIVLDTSGSMFTDGVLEQLLPAVEMLRRTRKVHEVYSCDTEIARVRGNAAKGQGGTLFDSQHVDWIKKDLGLKASEKLAVLYLTDGDIYQETVSRIRQRGDTDFHVIDVARKVTM